MTEPNGQMTRSERNELVSLAKKRERVAKTLATHRSAQLRADFERQLDTKYLPEQDSLWDELYSQAEKVVAEAREKLALDCQTKGIPAQCAPDLHLSWYERGRNAFSKERIEMRRVAYSRIEELEKGAKAEIERVSLQIQTELIAGSLESNQAKEFLERMPAVEALMPPLEMAEIEAKLLR